MKQFSLTIILVFCFLKYTQAQSWEELNQSTLDCINNRDYLKGIEYAEKATIIAEKVFGKKHNNYFISKNYLARLNYYLGNYEKAELLYIEVLTLKENALGKDHPDYATSLNNLALFYTNLGQYSKAEPLYIKALDIRRKSYDSNRAEYASTLNNLAILYFDLGFYTKSEELYIEALKIKKELYGSEFPDYATTLNNLAILYFSLGNFVKAETLYIEVLNIRKNILGTDHPDYAQSLNNLAALYFKEENYTKAEPLYLEAAQIRKKVLDSIHPDYAQSLNNLALLYEKLGNYIKAESLYIEVENIWKKTLGPSHPEYASFLNNFALLYYKNNNYAKALQLYFEALHIREKSLGTNHPDYTSSLNNIAVLYNNIGEFDKAEQYYLLANKNLNHQIDYCFSFLSEKEKEQFLDHNISFYFERYNSFFFKRREVNPSVIGISYDNELAHKGMLLHSNKSLRQAVYGSGDSVIINTYKRFIDIHIQLSSLYTTPLSERKKNIDSLENVANILEKELIGKEKGMSGIENITKLTKVKWQDIQKNLEHDEVAIEFVNFHYYDKRWTDSTFYCALILRKDYSYPRMIYLFQEKQLQEIISTSEATDNANYINKLYNFTTNQASTTNKSAYQNLIYQLIWQPIDSLLIGIRTIYLAPSGLLNRVAFNAIPVNDSTFISDKYHLNILSSTSLLLQTNITKTNISNGNSALLYGGIEYDIDSTEMITLSKHYLKSDLENPANRTVFIPENKRGLSWSYLPGTLTEVTNINNIFKSKLISVTCYTGKEATEESFYHVSDNGKSPEIIHIATHGFFFPETKPGKIEMEKIAFRGGILNESGFIFSENPLFRSGILLAGANRIWENSSSIPGVEDGTLTAYEVSNMNLSNTKLVVLSACETGLGDINGSEGVYGLQRAFKIAGVQDIIISLWQVPDAQTSELMQLFYSNCMKGMTINEGFRTAQQTMRKKYDPFYWAAFVLAE
jgi:CHAT domain-containing protein/Tfp pilus assembly protein PilF